MNLILTVFWSLMAFAICIAVIYSLAFAYCLLEEIVEEIIHWWRNK